ncbi:uncharacterized protein ASPGLDRAFT_40072 [Aspergillus glaucus CBS 516.65]|uniref:Ketoreductase (KR) domain-containing protein n=1 Tax=Aspergillus glaucus CBS 516.65 TaxID=1160497 RepID=A0A1L9V5K0_ASPGL|nr:hypothetical protein ASPGLDRAFT_40072 [Aspergillus glaucus CBS 516.65]OJJ79203.1 hypothetical protein ASPGLDRAFT_40072 [Aspergillus glaucus CBS 516.65]
MTSMKNKVFVIFGGASGMGLLNHLHTSFPADQSSHCFVQTGSVTDESAVEAFLTKTKSHFGKLNGVANYAGVPAMN